jgi:hypothetical protein
LIKWATLGFNFALGFSCFHTLVVNAFLLPRELRPGIFPRLMLVLGGLFFLALGVLTTMNQLGLLQAPK